MAANNQQNQAQMKGPGRRMAMGPKPKLKDPGKIMKRLLSYIFKQYRLPCIAVLICIVISSLASVVGTMFMKNLIDDYILPFVGQKNPDFSSLFQVLCKMALVYLAGVLSTWAYSRMMVNISQGTMRSIRNDLFTHMELLPIKYFDTHAHGDIMSIYTNDTDTLRQMISQSIPQVISSVITIAGVFVSMMILNIPLTLVTIIMVTVMLTVTKRIASKCGTYFAEQQKNLGVVNGFIEEMMEGQKVVKVFCHEEDNEEKFYDLNEKLFESADGANRYANILMPITANLGHISYVLTAIVGALLAIYKVGNFTLGSLASFLQFNRSFFMPISQVSQQINSIVMALAGADRVFRLLDETPEVDDGYVELVNAIVDEKEEIKEVKQRTGTWAWKHYHKADDTTTYQKMQGDVVFDHVDFGYNDDKIILHDIVIDAKQGQKIAFVGATGAGKTTITNLINRFYDIQDGKIRYDGININKIKKADLRRSLGIVLQDTHLFTGTVKENIRYGRLDATDEEVISAAKLANAHHFIKHLPEGYDTVLTGDGSNLSQGQRQLLAIARAAIADPPVLILDEATSSIDTRTEKIVQEGMDRLMHGRTVFVIAHRLSTIKNSDVILVLDQGRIIERGNHERLLEKKGTYYQLYTGLLEQS
ncbi:ABC transporter ATP-binding protein [Anaerosporobacter faecicola]|uniref:ABC transporter ATP-binding protein n=1 Tax=Anaerosporobacter faecicola TaxID=2718714 RepID=UPI0014394952|nr:ABC transporter ATP-binding protein [Anaerosporobacter faecicola]